MNKLKSAHYILCILFTLALYSCQNDGSTNEQENDSLTHTEDTLGLDTLPSVNDTTAVLPFIVEYDENTGRFNIEENSEAGSRSFSSAGLVEALTKKYPEIQPRVGERNQDTIQIYIDDASYLTQSIGSAGANNYLAEATFAFTSLDSVNVVNFLFKPGDHALPGPYTRKSFDDFH